MAAASGKDKDRRTWAKAICVLHDMPVVSPAEQFLRLTVENREKVRTYVVQLIAAQGTTEGKMEGGAECYFAFVPIRWNVRQSDRTYRVFRGATIWR